MSAIRRPDRACRVGLHYISRVQMIPDTVLTPDGPVSAPSSPVAANHSRPPLLGEVGCAQTQRVATRIGIHQASNRSTVASGP